MTIFSSAPRCPAPPKATGTGGTFADTTSFPKPQYRKCEPRLRVLDREHTGNARSDATRFREMRAQLSAFDRFKPMSDGSYGCGPGAITYSSFIDLSRAKASSRKGTIPQAPRPPLSGRTEDKVGPFVNLRDLGDAVIEKNHGSASGLFAPPVRPLDRSAALIGPAAKANAAVPAYYEAPTMWRPPSFHKNSPRSLPSTPREGASREGPRTRRQYTVTPAATPSSTPRVSSIKTASPR